MMKIKYIPEKRVTIPLVDENSLWNNISTILLDIIQRFNLKTDLALEFGVYWGCSTSALATYWKKVIAVDPFMGNNLQERSRMYYHVMHQLRDYNVQLIMGRYQEFIMNEVYPRYDIIHIDMIHSFEDTIAGGAWACEHSDCVIFHDTGIDGVRHAVEDLAEKYGFTFYNFEEGAWLGILVNEN